MSVYIPHLVSGLCERQYSGSDSKEEGQEQNDASCHSQVEMRTTETLHLTIHKPPLHTSKQKERLVHVRCEIPFPLIIYTLFEVRDGLGHYASNYSLVVLYVLYQNWQAI